MKYSILVQQDLSSSFVKLLNSFDSIEECIEEVKNFTKQHYSEDYGVEEIYEYNIEKDHEKLKYIAENSFFMMDQYDQDYIKSQHLVCYVDIKDFDDSNVYCIIQN